MLQRAIFTSGEMSDKMKLLKKSRFDVFSFFPIDPGDCICAKMISEWKDKLKLLPTNEKDSEIERTRFLTCPKSKVGLKRYVITCKNCGEIQGYCWARNATLMDFCDFHYVQYTDGQRWHGCLTPNISPITQQLTLECTCGQDTRDFRANLTLPGRIAIEIENSNKIGRDFGKASSKFLVSLVRLN